MKKLPISIAYSSDSDDAFMIEALKANLIQTPKNYQFSFCADDIQKLNESCLQNTYDICAISCGMYPLIKNNYQILSIGTSVADKKCSPTIITHKSSKINNLDDLTNKKIAVAGINTTNYLCAKILLNEFEPVFCNFNLIASLVKNKKVDAGILIHEAQITELEDFKILGNIGSLWYKNCQCYLPLGAIVIKRSLNQKDKITLCKLYKKSIDYATSNKDQLIKRIYENFYQVHKSYKLNLDKQTDYIDNFVIKSQINIKKNNYYSFKCFFQKLYDHNLAKTNISMKKDLIIV